MIVARAIVLCCLSTVLVSFKEAQGAVLKNSIQEQDESVYDGDIINENIFGITNGTKTTIQHHPYQAAIWIDSFGFNFRCSGAILNKKYIVTKYINPSLTSNVYVGVGKSLLSEMQHPIPVEEIIVHPKYTADLNYDISLIKLQTPLKFSKTVKPIAIPTTGLETGQSATVSGWGLTNIETQTGPSNRILEVTQSVISQKDCKPYYNSSIVSDNLFCAYKSQFIRPHLYDYGDPLVQNNKLYGLYARSLELYGICLSKVKCPSIYTDVVKLRDWITENIKL